LSARQRTDLPGVKKGRPPEASETATYAT